MQHRAVITAALLALVMSAGTEALGGAKEGKMRWSAQRTGRCKWYPAIKVPSLKDKTPGEYVLKIVYKANELAEFFVIGDGDSDLDLIVKDSKGTIVAKDVDPTAREGGGSDMCVCRWRPMVEEEFTIIIQNWGITNFAQAGSN
jgi:hypothetical protein